MVCVDDNPSIGESIRRLLAKTEDFVWVDWLPGLDDLDRVIEERQPDLILLDVDMPGPDPFAAVEKLAATHPAVKVVMLSGHVRQEYVFKAMEGGAWGYLYKGDPLEELLASLRKIVAGDVALTSLFHAENCSA